MYKELFEYWISNSFDNHITKDCFMEMNKDFYQDLILRFSKELNEVGITQSCIDLVKDKYSRTPNVVGCSSEEVTAKFCYQHNGFKIEAKQVVTLELKKIK